MQHLSSQNHSVGESPVFAKIRTVLVPAGDNEIHMQRASCKVSRHQKEQNIPFQDVYANIKTKTVQMTERNAFCGAYHTTVLLKKDDEHRVVGYGGGELVAVGSRDRAVRLMDVSSSKEVSPLIRGHAGSIRAVLLCEGRNLVITASYDLSIRCWNLKTGASMMTLRGHLGTINCLDLHANTLVSGAKDCKVKVWDLATGRCFENLKFRHRSPVWCVKIDTTLLFSSCGKGLVKMWDIEIASLLKVIDAHQSAVKCLFFDNYHIVTGDSEGQVMAWSTNVNAKGCLMTFHHPREVRSVMLSDLCVITGCTDERIRTFSFLTGHCLRTINTESPILSIHIHGDSIIVNTRSSVLLYQFDLLASWDAALTNNLEGTDQTSLPNFNHMAQAGPSILKVRYSKVRTPKKRTKMSHHARSLSASTVSPAQAGKYCVTTKVQMARSVRAVHERLVKNKAFHQPPSPSASQPPATQDKHLKQPVSRSPRQKSKTLKLPALQGKYPNTTTSLQQKQRNQTQELPSIWGKHSAPQQVLYENTTSCVPLLSKPLNHNLRPSLDSEGASSTSRLPALMQPAARDNYKNSPINAPLRKVGAFTTTAAEGPQAPERMLMKALCKRPGQHVCFAIPAPPADRDNPTDTFREQAGFRLLTDAQLKEHVRVLSQSSPGTQPRRSKTAEDRQQRMIWRMKLKGFPTSGYTKKDQVYAPELGHDTYI